jgi:HPt (histidine-containing phosphotransfer) domain-containing protein
VVITGSAAIPGAAAPLPVGVGLADDGTREGVTREVWSTATAPPMGSGQPSLKRAPGVPESVVENKWSTSAAAARKIEQEDPAAPLVPIDTARLESSCMGIPALRESLLQTFRADIGPRMMRLAEAVVAGDPRRVEFEAHGLKGMSATIGAVACEAAFEEIERLGRDEDLRTASRLLQIAQGTAERTEQFISRLERILSQADEAA